jgi:hypothetical protein
MAYVMATNRHITPKPGQGRRVCAAWWTLVIWPPAWVGQNSVTGFRHEPGSAWAMAGRTSATAIMAAMAAAGLVQARGDRVWAGQAAAAGGQAAASKRFIHSCSRCDSRVMRTQATCLL